MNNKIKKGNLNYDQSGRAYPDNPQIKENWNCIWEKDGKHYKLVGDNEHKEWEEMENNIETIAKRYWEIYNHFEGQTHLIDVEMEVINMLAEELFYNGDMDNMPKILANMYFLGKINQQFEKENGK